MLESIVNPTKTDVGSWRMFVIGIVYASLSVLLVKLFFSKDTVLYSYAGIIVVTFAVLCTLPFMYFLTRDQEDKDEKVEGFFSVWRIHRHAIFAFIWLFLGFVLAFSFWYIFLHDQNLFNAQINTYCMINSPGNIEDCVSKYSVNSINSESLTGYATSGARFLSIISNNIYVMIFTLVFSLIFGAGAIFILAWNASVIAAAIGVFTKYQISAIPVGVARYMIHGIPEIAAYFATALAGGIFGVGILRHGIKDKMFTRIIENSAMLLFIAILLLVFAAVVEVYVTPMLFS